MPVRRSCCAAVLAIAAWLAGCNELLGNQEHGVLAQEESDANASEDAPADAPGSEDRRAPDASLTGSDAADAGADGAQAMDGSAAGEGSTDAGTGADAGTVSHPPADGSVPCPTCGLDGSAADAGEDAAGPLETLTVNFRGLGTQTASIASNPAGISCSGASCTSMASFAYGTSVLLTVTRASGTILGWSNACTADTCSVTLYGPQTIHVTTTNQNLVFVADVATSSPAFGGLSGADALCAAAAANAGLPGHYVALLGTSTMNIYGRLGVARGWIRTDGLPFTDTAGGFQNGVMWYPLGVDPSGAFFRANIWTGSVAGENCADWTSSSASAATGLANAEGTALLDLSQNTCSPGYDLACFGTDLATPVTVSPATGRLAFSSSATLLSGGVPAADALCQMEASAAGLANPTHFLAALSTSKATAASRFDLSGAPWVRVDGVQIAATPADLMAGTLLAPPYTDASGMPVNEQLWVGSAGGLTALSGSANESCADWTSTSAAVTGQSTQTGFALPDDFAVQTEDPSACNVASSVLCLEN